MLGLPAVTEISRQLPKSAFFTKLALDARQRARFDADISKMFFTNVLSAKTLPAIAADNAQPVYVLHVVLKRQDFEAKNLELLVKLTKQRIVFVLTYSEKGCLAVFEDKIFTGAWQSLDKLQLQLEGFDLNKVWENFVLQIGSFSLQDEHTLTEQISYNEAESKLLKQIDRLEKKCGRERQPRRKAEIYAQMQSLRQKLRELQAAYA